MMTADGSSSGTAATLSECAANASGGATSIAATAMATTTASSDTPLLPTGLLDTIASMEQSLVAHFQRLHDIIDPRVRERALTIAAQRYLLLLYPHLAQGAVPGGAVSDMAQGGVSALPVGGASVSSSTGSMHAPMTDMPLAPATHAHHQPQPQQQLQQRARPNHARTTSSHRDRHNHARARPSSMPAVHPGNLDAYAKLTANVRIKPPPPPLPCDVLPGGEEVEGGDGNEMGAADTNTSTKLTLAPELNEEERRSAVRAHLRAFLAKPCVVSGWGSLSSGQAQTQASTQAQLAVPCE